MRQYDSVLARLILVDVRWSEWNSERDRKTFVGIIKQLFDLSSRKARDVEAAYIHMCYEKDDQKPWKDQQAFYDLPPWDDCPDPEWFENEEGPHKPKWFKDDAEGLRKIKSALPMEITSEQKPGKVGVHGVPEWGQFFRARIFMDANRYRAAVECEGDANYWALVDMRFQRVSESLVLWHTSLSVWSGLPRNNHQRPDQVPFRESQPMSSEDADRLTRDFRKHSRAGFRTILTREVIPMELRVFDRLYEPPAFLVAVPLPRARQTNMPKQCQYVDNRHDNQPDVFQKMSNEVLWSHHYKSLPGALLKGGVNVYRRFYAVDERDRPRYFLIPDTGWAPSLGAWRSKQEEATAIDVGILGNLEAYAASRLRGIDTRMQILENHLKIYQGVAEQAGTLWDALARLLPDARGSVLRSSVLEDVHRLIEMIHQTLLQGVADLNQLVRNIDTALSEIDATADEVADRFDRELHHPSPPTEGSAYTEGSALRDSLRSGYIDRLRRRVGDDAAAAARVMESYRTLLDTIGLAFDERRVREGDRIQRASVWLAIGFGVLGVSGIAQATAPVPTIGNTWAWSLKISLWLLFVAVLAWVGWLIKSLGPVGQIATQEFERQYKFVRNFLAEASTDYLDRFSLKQAAGSQPKGSRDWPELDEQLCGKFIEAWDAISTYTNKYANQEDLGVGLYDAPALRRRVEEWSLETLLLTERPRDFSRYSLPKLTCLYRVCTAEKLKDWAAISEPSYTYSAVGDAELQEVLSKINKYDSFRREEDQLRQKTPRGILNELDELIDCQQSHTSEQDVKHPPKPEQQLSPKPRP